MDIRSAVISIGQALGFDKVRISSVSTGKDTEFVHEWLRKGFAGEMAYLKKRAEERADPLKVLSGARNAICVALVYDRQGCVPGPVEDKSLGRIARYAGGEDYHTVMLERLEAFATAIQVKVRRSFTHKAYVDTGPVLERTLAARGGLGWIGKNTLLLDRELGSYFFIGVLFTDLEIDLDEPVADLCGSCTACLDACPTDAFPEPHVMDASRCLSYTTIEKSGIIPKHLRAPQGNWIFGCDVCQEVCPWNNRKNRMLPLPGVKLREKLKPKEEFVLPSLRWILDLDEDNWREITAKTSIRRAKWRGLIRNALIAAGNSGDLTLFDSIMKHAEGVDPGLREHAEWAIGQLLQTRRAASDAKA